MELKEASYFDHFNSSSIEFRDSFLLTDNLNLSIVSDNVSSNESYHEVYTWTDKTFWALLLLPLPLVAVFGNILVILSVIKERGLQTVTNYFIVSLAVADLLVAAVVMPFAVYVLVNGNWELSDSLCDLYIAVDVICSTSSIFNLVAISVDRYIAVTQPIKYSKHKNKSRVILTIVGVWVISTGIGSPIFLGMNTSPERTPELCVFYNSDFIILSSIGSFYIPCIIMLFLYYKIFKVIHERARKNKLRQTNSESGGIRSSGSGSLTNEPPATISRRHEKEGQMQSAKGLQIVVEKEGFTTNTGSGSQEDEYDDDTFGEDSFRQGPAVKGASAMLLSAFMTETIRIEIPINGNTDSGYGTSHVEQETQFASTVEHESPRDGCVGDVILSKSSQQRKRNGTSKIKGNDDSNETKKKSRFNLGRRNKNNRKKREKVSAKRERKATKTLAIVLGVFLFCWMPFFTCNVLDAICIKLENDDWRPGMTMFLLTTWLGYINSCVNPVIYTIFNMEFRKAFKKLLVDYWWC